MMAASRGGDGIVKSFLNHLDVDIDEQDSDGFTALCLAAESGSQDSVPALVEYECDVNIANKSGYSALFLAVMNGDCDMVNLLLRSGADPYLHDKAHGTILQRAVHFGRINVVKLLLEGDHFKAEDLDNDGQDLLTSACRHGHLEIIVLLKDRKLELDSRDHNGWTALHHAVSEGKFDVVQLLLDFGVDCTVEENDGNTPLDIALQHGQPHIASLLRGESINEQSISPNIIDANITPIWYLAKQGLADILKQALAIRQTDMFAREPGSDWTAIHLAAVENHTETLQLLLETTTLDVESVDSEAKRKPLHLAAVNGCLEATELLLEHDPGVDRKDAFGCTPLYLTKIENKFPDRYRVAAALVEAGAATKYADIQKTLFAALQMGRQRAVEILVNAGADVWAPDETGQRAINVTDEEEILRTLRTSKSFISISR